MSDTVIGSINSKVLFHSHSPPKMANGKIGSVLTESNIHNDKVFLGRRVKTFITALVKGIPNKHTSLSPMGKFGQIRAKIVDINSIPKYTKRNLRNRTSRGVGLLKTF